MTDNKIKSLLSLRGLHYADWARSLSITPQGLNKKKNKNQYKFTDLITLADITDTELAFIDKETGKPLIVFDANDLKTGGK